MAFYLSIKIVSLITQQCLIPPWAKTIICRIAVQNEITKCISPKNTFLYVVFFFFVFVCLFFLHFCV